MDTTPSPAEVVERLGRLRAVAILRTTVPGAAGAAMAAAVRGGFRAVELTLGTPDALTVVAELAGREGLLVGAGTVLTPAEARAAVAAGAAFLVSPVVDEAVISEAARLGVAMIPGAATPSEMLRAHRAGAPLQKLFPAPVDGPGWVRAVLGPLPFLRIVPTSGVDAGNAAAFLAAGAHAVGFVRPLFDPDEVARGDVAAIEARARRLLAAVDAAG